VGGLWGGRGVGGAGAGEGGAAAGNGDDGAAANAESKEGVELSAKLKTFVNDFLAKIRFTSWKMDDETAAKMVDWATGLAGSLAITGVKSAIGILVGLLIMVISLYYFLADGPLMIRALM